MRLYVMPVELVEAYPGDVERRPKYLALLGGLQQMLDYGPEPTCLVVAAAPDAKALAAMVDVLEIPADLDAALTADAVRGAQQKLAACHMPAAWLGRDGLTWRQVVRGIAGLCLYLQAYGGLTDYAPVLTADGALEVQVASLPAAKRAALDAASTARRLDAKALAVSSQLRDVLGATAAQAVETPVVLGGVTI